MSIKRFSDQVLTSGMSNSTKPVSRFDPEPLGLSFHHLKPILTKFPFWTAAPPKTFSDSIRVAAIQVRAAALIAHQHQLLLHTAWAAAPKNRAAAQPRTHIFFPFFSQTKHNQTFLKSIPKSTPIITTTQTTFQQQNPSFEPLETTPNTQFYNQNSQAFNQTKNRVKP